MPKHYPYIYKFIAKIDGEKVRSIVVYAETQDEAKVFAIRRFTSLGYRGFEAIMIDRRDNKLKTPVKVNKE